MKLHPPFLIPLGMFSCAFALSACGGSSTPPSHAAGAWTGVFTDTKPNTDSGTVSFSVDSSGNIVSGVIVDKTSGATGTITGIVTDNLQVDATLAYPTVSFVVTGTFSKFSGNANGNYQARLYSSTDYSGNFTVGKTSTSSQ